MRCLASLAFSLLLFIICAAAGRAQEAKCALTLGQSPELGGLRLGMAAEQVKTRFKIIEDEEADDFGVATLRLNPGHNALEAEAVRDISIELIGERIAAIRLVYSPLDAPTNYREFTARLSKRLGLPLAWRPMTYGATVTGMMMRCAGFKVKATLIGMRIQVVYMYGLKAEPTLDRRQAEKERRLRDYFKP